MSYLLIRSWQLINFDLGLICIFLTFIDVFLSKFGRKLCRKRKLWKICVKWKREACFRCGGALWKNRKLFWNVQDLCLICNFLSFIDVFLPNFAVNCIARESFEKSAWHTTMMCFDHFHSSLLFEIEFSYSCEDLNYFCKIRANFASFTVLNCQKNVEKIYKNGPTV